ncbi:hypothetical protein cypCar_00000703 [Cyprinus carpio]|nr:hypothetical protein cypCar_00000703 [Cyprinus carpio]
MQKEDETPVPCVQLCPPKDRAMRKPSDMSPRRLSDISPQIRQLKSLVIDEDLSEELKSSRSVEYINNASIEERILRITGYYGYEPWDASRGEDQPNSEKVEVKIVAAILAIGGIVMMTYADGFHSYSVIGISLVVGSASTAAIYKVLFKLVLGSAKLGEAAVYLTVLGGANLVFISAVPLILLLMGAEDFVSHRDLPWPSICGMSALLLVFNFLLNFGVLITLPTLISLGVVLSVPLNAVIDRYMCEIQLNSVRIIAVSIICLGFLLLLLPEDWDQCLPQLRSMLYNREEPQESARDKHSETLHIRPGEAKNCNSKTTPSIH